MLESVVTGLLWFCAVGCGLMAGVYFAFSTFIMTALARIDQAHGIAAMNAINSTILGSLFLPVFFGTTLASAALAVLALARLARLGDPGAAAMLVGGLVYVAGMFVCTMIFNVPLNKALAGVDAAGADGAITWAHYLRNWTLWNHVRTIASIVAAALFIAVIAAR